MNTKVLIILGIGLFFILLTWWAIFDVAYKDFGSFEKKLIWGFIVLIPFIGCLVYVIFGRQKGVKTLLNNK